MDTFASMQALYPRWRFVAAMLADYSPQTQSLQPRSIIFGTDDRQLVLVTSLSGEEAWREVCKQVAEIEKD